MVGEYSDIKKRMIYDTDNQQIGIFPILFDSNTPIVSYKGFRFPVKQYNGSNQKFQVIEKSHADKLKSLRTK